MKLLFAITFILISHIATAQTKEEVFVQEVYSNFIDTSSRSFNLFESAYTINLLNDNLLSSLKNIVTDSIGKSLQFVAAADTSILWQKYAIPKSVLVDKNQADTLTGRIIQVTYKGEPKNIIEKQNKELNKKRGSVYRISNPIFDTSQTFALIEVSNLCGSGCGTGCTYLFHLIDGKWVKIQKFLCWIS